MGLLARLFAKPKNPAKDELPMTEEGRQLLSLRDFLRSLLADDRYIPRSAYLETVDSAHPTAQFFGVLRQSGTLDTYCKQKHLLPGDVAETLDTYEAIADRVEAHNEAFLERHLRDDRAYLDGILREVDPKILLDEDQRRVVLTDEDYCLVIAGAGAGKTTTVAAKVKYLVEKQRVDPKQILVVSFTNKAVGELREKLNRDLKIDCPITTFHSTGNAILRKQSPEPLNIVDDSKLYLVLQDYFRTSVLQNESLVNQLILFFASYFDAPYDGQDLAGFLRKLAGANYATIRSDLNEFERDILDVRTKKIVTVQNEVMRSAQEVEIANFLYLQGLEYEYEPNYPYHILYARKPYTPDFIIRQGENTVYLEHFGLTEDGRNDRYNDDQLAQYQKAMRDKVELHRTHGTKLLYTFSSYRDGRTLTEHLRELLEQNGFTMQPRSDREVMDKLLSTEGNRYIRKLVTLICRFISNFKTNGYTAEEFDRMYHSTQNVRSRLFLNICRECYLEYDRYLKEQNAVDFQDMINGSARLLREAKEMKTMLDFRYVIVDEYQDISRQRFDLVSALHDVTDAKIIAVGDDWQSIYAFSGSDITLFTRFEEKMGYAKQLKIVRTYRNSQEVIDIAGGFVQKNPTQIRKDLISPKTIIDPVIIYTYDGSRKKKDGDRYSGADYQLAKAVETALEQIIAYNKAEGKPEKSSVLLLGRFGFDGDHLEKTGLFEYIDRGSRIKSVKYPRMDITFMTAHASKGLGYDNVIIVNGKNETYGFPSKIEDDPVLGFVIKGDRSIDYAEERRLFYVAMTRTKNRVFCIAPEQNPSEFLLELKRDYKNVALRGNWNEEPPAARWAKKTCPLCGYPMQFRYKSAYGLRLYICTNEPEICGFLTNEASAGKLSIQKCENCRDGYLIVKPGDKDYFLGCTNYKKDKTGCSKTVSRQQYYAEMGYPPDPEPPVAPAMPERYQKPVKAPVSPETTAPEPVAEIAPLASKKVEEYGVAALDKTVVTLLRGLHHVSERQFYGVTMLLDLLQGSRNERLLKNGLDKLPEYGALKKTDRKDLQTIVFWLIDEGFILQTKGQYPVLHPTYESAHYGETMTVGKLRKLNDLLKKAEGTS